MFQAFCYYQNLAGLAGGVFFMQSYDARRRSKHPESKMVFDISVALTWILFLALFPMAFFWLRRAWRILARGDYSEVAIKGGEAPANPKKFAPYAAAINLIPGGIAAWLIINILLGKLEYDTWSAIAGMTIWLKFIADFILSRHAHPFTFGKKTKRAE
jgi:hypothetical protein